MSEQENLGVIHEAYEAFGRGDVAGVVETDWVHAFTLRDGKIANFRGYEDSAAVADAFTAKQQTT